jgi:hypothetical protein
LIKGEIVSPLINLYKNGVLAVFIGVCFSLNSWAWEAPETLEKTDVLGEQYRLVLSAVNRMNNSLAIDESYVLKVEGERNLYLFAKQESVFDIFNARIAELGMPVLYQCEGSDCGSSNLWANSIFKESRLYTRDKLQHYWVGKSGSDMVVLYCVQRGNKRNYCLEDRIQVLEGLPKKLMGEPSIDDYVELPYFNFTSEKGLQRNGLALVSRLQQFLNEYPRGDYYLVAELTDAVPLRQYDKRYHEEFRGLMALVKQLSKAQQKRISVQVILGLMPGSGNKNRVLLVAAGR